MMPREGKAGLLAEMVRKWGRVGVGLAAYFEEVPHVPPAGTLACLAVNYDGRSGTWEYRFGGDSASLRIRCATLTLALLRCPLGPGA